VRDYNWKIPPVTGAYNIGAFKKGKYIDFIRNPDWWANDKKYYQHRFNPDTLRIKVIRNDDVAFRYFLKGEIDTFALVMPRLWHGKAQGEPFDDGYILKAKFYNNVPVPSSGMWLNSADPILQDIAVRKALAHAVNVDKVIKTVLRNDYERLNTHHQGYGDYSNNSIRPRDFNLATANSMLEQAGWDTKGGDGIRLKNGQPLSLRITYMSDDHTPRLVILRESARKAGIDLKLQFLDMSTGFKQVLEKKHQIAWMGWGEGGIAPRFWQHYHSANANKPQTNNITNTADPLMDDKIERYRSSVDRDTRIALAQQLEQMIYDKAVFIPTFAVPYTRSGYWRWMKLPRWMGTKETTDLFSFSAGLHWIDNDEKATILAAKKAGTSYPPQTIINDDFRGDK
jgi:microcin C transport system substrate-binding protein